MATPHSSPGMYGCSPRLLLRRPMNELRKRDIPQGFHLSSCLPGSTRFDLSSFMM